MTDEAAWTLDPRLAQDSISLGDMPLSRVLLMNDANYPWLILVLPSENEGLILAQAVRGFASMVQRKGFAMVALK